MSILQQDIQFLPGVGPNRKKMLSEELGISTIGDLLQYYPYRYVDRSRLYSIRELTGDMPYVQVKGRILSFETFKMGGRKERVVAHFTDGSGRVMDLVWFVYGKNALNKYKVNTDYVVFGKPAVFNGRIQLVHPDMEEAKNMGFSLDDLKSIMDQNLSGLNELIPAYEKISEIVIHEEEFEKTPKKSIKRYLYQ